MGRSKGFHVRGEASGEAFTPLHVPPLCGQGTCAYASVCVLVCVLMILSQSHTLSRLQRRVVNVAYFYVRKKMK